jgi:hypothetical protein
VRRPALLTLVAALLASPAAAHRGHSSLTAVEIDPAGAVTVTHRLQAHDVEPALVDLAPDAQPSVDDPEALAALIAHGARAFRLWDERGPVRLTHAKTELAGDDVRLTYTGRLAGPGRALQVDSDLLEATHADQENQVNVRRARITRTVLFRPGDPTQLVEFDTAKAAT